MMHSRTDRARRVGSVLMLEHSMSHIFMCEPYLTFHSNWIYIHTPRAARKTRAQKRKVRVHGPLLAVLNVCVGAIAARALRPPSHTESIESAQVLSSMVPCWHSGSTRASPFVS